MKQSKDPFEAAYEEQDESPADSPIGGDEFDTETPMAVAGHNPVNVTVTVSGGLEEDDDDDLPTTINPSHSHSSTSSILPTATSTSTAKNKDYDYDYDDENVDVELSKFPASADPVKTAKMQAILSQFTEEQMSRYESFRRSALQRSNMRRLLVSITGSQKISLPMTIVVCGIAKMFVGELVETARIVMTERKESGPIRPCHVREAYRRLKLEGKVPKRSVSRLFR